MNWFISVVFISVLIYEPDHEEANSFKDLIAEKVQLGKLESLLIIFAAK